VGLCPCVLIKIYIEMHWEICIACQVLHPSFAPNVRYKYFGKKKCCLNLQFSSILFPKIVYFYSFGCEIIGKKHMQLINVPHWEVKVYTDFLGHDVGIYFSWSL
jgi:hypothetical protein